MEWRMEKNGTIHIYNVRQGSTYMHACYNPNVPRKYSQCMDVSKYSWEFVMMKEAWML